MVYRCSICQYEGRDNYNLSKHFLSATHANKLIESDIPLCDLTKLTLEEQKEYILSHPYYREIREPWITELDTASTRFNELYDITNEKSFESLNFWVEELKYKSDQEKLVLCLAGNKCDMEDRKVQVNTAKGN